MSLLERLIQDNYGQGEKIALLELQIAEERSTIEVKLAQEKASIDKREKSLSARSAQLEGEIKKLSEELGEVRLEMSRDLGDLSASETVKRQLESDVHDLSAQCKDYEKKIMDARESAELIGVRSTSI